MDGYPVLRYWDSVKINEIGEGKNPMTSLNSMVPGNPLQPDFFL